jgi:Lon protease-like protein
MTLPEEAAVMSLPNAVLFPHSLLPLHIFEPRYREMLDASLQEARMFVLALMRPGVNDVASIQDIHSTASIGLIRACVGKPDGTSNLILQGLTRVKVVEWIQEEPFRMAKIEVLESRLTHPIEAEALGAKVKELCESTQPSEILHENLGEQLRHLDDPEVLADVVAAAYVTNTAYRQRILEEPEVADRLRLIIDGLNGSDGNGNILLQ